MKRIVLAATLGVMTSNAQAAEQQRWLNFVACPVMRDTATVPCWLSEYKGELYYLVLQQSAAAAVYPPYLGHQVLVEGVVSDEPRICGGLVLKPVKLSNLPELDPSCNTILPAEDRYQVKAPRGPGPSPPRGAGGPPPARPVAAPLTGRHTFSVSYEFDVDWANRSGRVISEVVDYAKASKASAVEIVAYRGATKLSAGGDYVERSDIAERRARRLQDTFAELGVDPAVIKIVWRDKPSKTKGPEDYMNRRAEITVTPGIQTAGR